MPPIQPPLQDCSVSRTYRGGRGDLYIINKAPAHERMVQILDGVQEAKPQELLAMVAGYTTAYNDGRNVL